MAAFGEIWENWDEGYWDRMWDVCKESPAVQQLLDLAEGSESLCEVGCGHGHFLQTLLQRGWRGRFVGYEFSAWGVTKVRRICTDYGIEHTITQGDFLEAVGSDVPSCDVAVAHDVVIHQAHWMPMVLGMLRIAPVAAVGIGYLNPTGFHHIKWMDRGHYDSYFSPSMLEREAKSVGLKVALTPSVNTRLNRKEVLALFYRND